MKLSQYHQLKSLILIFMLIFISSCEEDVDGNWEPMEWGYENVSDGIKIIEPSGKDKDQVKYSTKIEVSKSGSIEIVCKNYKSIWFADYPNTMSEEDPQFGFNNDFSVLKIERNTLHCEFFNIEEYKPEVFYIVLTAGDIFYHFEIEIK